MTPRTRILIAGGCALVAATIVVGAIALSDGMNKDRPSASDTAAAMVGCRVSLTTPVGFDEGGKVIEIRAGDGGTPELHTQWGWIDDTGTDHQSDPGFMRPSYETDQWVPFSRVHGYACDGTTWTWVTP